MAVLIFLSLRAAFQVFRLGNQIPRPGDLSEQASEGVERAG